MLSLPRSSAPRLITPAEAATELLRRRSARKSLIGFTEYTNPLYKTAKVHERIAEQLERVQRKEIDRLALLLPPRHGKSELASRRLPAFALGINPRLQFISASATSDLASDFGRDVKNIIASQEYQKLYDTRLSADSQAKGKWHTSAGGIYYAVGVGGAVMGRGADIFMIDDPFATWEDAQSETTRKTVRDWYTGTVYNRLQPGGAIVLINHRMHMADLVGFVLEQQAQGGDKWEVVELPAIDEEEPENPKALWPEGYPLNRLNRIKRNTPANQWDALYMQRPSVAGGEILLRKWWKPWVGSIEKCLLIVQSYDQAQSEKTTADFTARTTWGIFQPEENGPYCALLLEAWKGRVGLPELLKLAGESYTDWQPDYVLLEQTPASLGFGQFLWKRGIPVKYYLPRADKIVRAHMASPMLESGRVYARWSNAKENFHPLVIDAIEECTQFPAAAHDDLTDTVTQLLITLKNGGLIQQPEEPEDEEPEPVGRRSLYG